MSSTLQMDRRRSAAVALTISLRAAPAEKTTCAISVEWTDRPEVSRKEYGDCDVEAPQEVVGVSRVRLLDYVHQQGIKRWRES